MSRYDEIEEVEKFNPYHDGIGRFSSANGAHSFTRFTNSKAGQKAISNIMTKLKVNGGGAGAPSSGEAKQPGGFGNTEKQTGHKPINTANEKYLDKWDEPDDKTYDKVAKDLGVSREEAQRMTDSVFRFSGDDFTKIREASRGDLPKTHNDQYYGDAQGCEDFIKASPKWDGGTLYRGLDVSNDVGQKILANAASGKPIDMQGTSSWSSSQNVATGFASSYGSDRMSIVLVTNGTSAPKGTSIMHLSQFDNEKEVMVSKEAVFTPTKMENMTSYGRDYIIIYGDMT